MPTLVFLFSELILIGVFDLFPWAIETFSESWCPETAPEKQMKFFSETRLVAENFGWGIFFARSKAGKQEVDSADVVFFFLPPPYRDQPYRCQPVVCLLSHCQHLHIYGQRSLHTLPHKQKKSWGIGESNFYCLLLALQKSRRLWESAFSALCIHPSPACKKDCLFLLDNTRKTIEIYEWMRLCLLTLCSLMLALPSQACRWAPWH